MTNLAAPAPIPLREASRSKSEKTRELLIAAGIQLFSRQGFEATTTRQIENVAEVQRNLMSYHFGGKDAFWKACMHRLFERVDAHLGQALEQSNDIEPRERTRFLIRRFIRASAANPELSRIMFDEGRSESWRLEWLVEQKSRSFFQQVRAIFEEGRERGAIPDIPFPNFYYSLVGGAAIFCMSAECEMLIGTSSINDAMVDAQADAIARLLTTSNT